MGLAQLLGEKNPFAMWVGDNQNYLAALASGLGQGQNIQSGLSAGLAAVPQAKALDYQATEKRKADAKVAAQTDAFKSWLSTKRPDLVPLLDTGMSPAELFNEAMRPAEQADYPAEYDLYKLTQSDPGFAGFLTQKGGAAERSLTPTFIQDANGNIVPGQLDKAGNLVPSKLPEGFQAVDPFAMAGGKASATVDAKTAAAARAALPGAQQIMTVTQKALAEVRNNATGMKEWFSQVGALPRGMLVSGGSEMGNFVTATKQANADAFLPARQMLKGGGQITDYEGRRGEDAFSRMQAALDTGDQQSYLRALTDFEAAVADGYQKLVETANGGYSQGGAQLPGGGKWTVLGVE